MKPEQRFLSEVVRPLAERLRALDYECQAALRQWHGGISDTIANDQNAIIDDGRVDHGIPGLAGSDIHALMAQIQSFVALMEKAGTRDVVQRPCVRALRVEV